MYKFWGKVRKANLRGRKLGFPTANVNLNKDIPEGIYLSRTKVNKIFYPSLTFIGKAKTFNEQKFQAETYILDFNENMYGEWISVFLLKKIRENKKFKSAEELIKQMEKDKHIARNFFSKTKVMRHW